MLGCFPPLLVMNHVWQDGCPTLRLLQFAGPLVHFVLPLCLVSTTHNVAHFEVN